MDELGKPKANEDGEKPKEGELRQWKSQEAKGGEQKAEVEKAGKGAEEGVVGEATVPKKKGVGPPDKPQNSPASGWAALEKI